MFQRTRDYAKDYDKIGSIAYYTQVESLCLAKGALDFYEVTPNTLLP